jgi:hypothetical protein
MFERREAYYNVTPKDKYFLFTQSSEFKQEMEKMGYTKFEVSLNKDPCSDFIGIFEFDPETCGDGFAWLAGLGYTLVIKKASKILDYAENQDDLDCKKSIETIRRILKSA